MVLFESQKLQKDGYPPRRMDRILRILPVLNAAAIILILTLISNNNSTPQQVRVQLSTSEHKSQLEHGLPFHHSEPANAGSHSTPTCDSPSSRGHVSLMENLLLDPHKFLEELVKQEGHTWLQIGSNTMDNMNGNDPLKRLLSRIPTWNKVSRQLNRWQGHPIDVWRMCSVGTYIHTNNDSLLSHLDGQCNCLEQCGSSLVCNVRLLQQQQPTRILLCGPLSMYGVQEPVART